MLMHSSAFACVFLVMLNVQQIVLLHISMMSFFDVML